MERISTIQTASVITQPTDAVERPLTLIEKLEQRKQDFEAQFVSDFWILEGLDKAIGIVKQHQAESCNWRNNKDTDGWYEWSDCGDYSSDCGLEWNMSNDDSPLENDMNFCPKCGRKIVEIQPPSEMQDD